jgi:NADH:ubiquinone oxidoreductase subunit
MIKASQWYHGFADKSQLRYSFRLDMQDRSGHEPVPSLMPAIGLSMRQFIVRFFTWWNGHTLGTQLWTWRFGERVGEDEFGNVYYRTKGGGFDPTIGVERRWVIYNGPVEGSRIPEGWNGWLHNTVDLPPPQETYTPRQWQKPHSPNMTGTPMAYRPKGSVLGEGARAQATGDYDAWRPG